MMVVTATRKIPFQRFNFPFQPFKYHFITFSSPFASLPHAACCRERALVEKRPPTILPLLGMADISSGQSALYVPPLLIMLGGDSNVYIFAD